jgi:hypothetical protein
MDWNWRESPKTRILIGLIVIVIAGGCVEQVPEEAPTPTPALSLEEANKLAYEACAEAFDHESWSPEKVKETAESLNVKFSGALDSMKKLFKSDPALELLDFGVVQEAAAAAILPQMASTEARADIIAAHMACMDKYIDGKELATWCADAARSPPDVGELVKANKLAGCYADAMSRTGLKDLAKAYANMWAAQVREESEKAGMITGMVVGDVPVEELRSFEAVVPAEAPTVTPTVVPTGVDYCDLYPYWRDSDGRCIWTEEPDAEGKPIEDFARINKGILVSDAELFEAEGIKIYDLSGDGVGDYAERFIRSGPNKGKLWAIRYLLPRGYPVPEVRGEKEIVNFLETELVEVLIKDDPWRYDGIVDGVYTSYPTGKQRDIDIYIIIDEYTSVVPIRIHGKIEGIADRWRIVLTHTMGDDLMDVSVYVDNIRVKSYDIIRLGDRIYLSKAELGHPSTGKTIGWCVVDREGNILGCSELEI